MYFGLHGLYLYVLFIKVFVDASSLYENDGSLTVLTDSNFANFVNTQPTFVQFYSSNCGTCQNYAPIFTNLSKSVSSWSWTIRVAVVDCANEENSDLCERYEIISFPMFLFFSRQNETMTSGKISDVDTFRKKLAGLLIDKEQHDSLIFGRSLPQAFTVYGPEKLSVAMIILDCRADDRINFQSELTKDSLFGVKDEVGNVLFSSTDENALRSFIAENITHTSQKDLSPLDDAVSSTPYVTKTRTLSFAMPVYAADISASLQHLLSHDVARKESIEGFDLEALKEFFVVLSKYLNLGQVLSRDILYIKEQIEFKTKISRTEWREIIGQTKKLNDMKHYIACRGSKPHLRGYPCGLWIMFHAMTVNRFLQGDKLDGRAPIAHALNRFVPRFFSCSYCAFHFAKMTSNVRLPGESIYPDLPGETPPFQLVPPDPAHLPTPPKSARDEVLWLNTAHNIVNKRLSGAPSDDPTCPKSIFPSPEHCQTCWSTASQEKWNKDKFSATPDETAELLAYLVHHYRDSSWRWDGISMPFEKILKLESSAQSSYSVLDMLLVGVFSVGCTAVLAAVTGLLYWRRMRARYSLYTHHVIAA